MSKTYIIAEAGVNHNGNLDLAREMIAEAKKSGADAVKFQLFQADKLVTRTARKAEYQQKATIGSDTQYEMLKRLELTQAAFSELLNCANQHDIDFLLTPFDLEALQFITEDLSLPIIKIGSGDITNGPLLLKAAQSQKKIILSTGMSTLDEIKAALNIIAYGYTYSDPKVSANVLENYKVDAKSLEILKSKVVLLHCTSEYPAPIDQVNLKAMDTMRVAFELPVGLSDHTVGIEVALGAVARGAHTIEKHFTLDKNLPGPDHPASLDIPELTAMVSGIRNIERALGNGIKTPTPAELKNRDIVRRSLVANQKISAGEAYNTTNISFKRPSAGLSPMLYWKVLEQYADKDYDEDEAIL